MQQISLTQGLFALVDDKDFDELNKHKWCAYRMSNGFYAYRGIYLGVDHITGKEISKSVSMARIIMNCPSNKEVDHKNGNTLDNQQHNLRICTHRENLQNYTKNSNQTSKYKGVSWDKINCKWRVTIYVEDILGRSVQLSPGRYDEEKDAAKVYDDTAKKEFGEFARLNFPEE